MNYTNSYLLEWNTKNYKNGDYNIFVRAFDYEGNYTDSYPITLRIENSFSISNGYPNPSDRRVTFTLKNPPESTVEISIVDVKGSSIFEKNVTLLQNENLINLNLKDYPSGVYMVNFDFKNNIPITRKICHLKGYENPCTE